MKTPPAHDIVTSGTIVYTKLFSKSLRLAPVQFPGMAVCMMLGQVAYDGKDITPVQAMRILGQSGFIMLDDVGQFLSEEMVQICIKKFEEKYYAPATPPPPKLIGINDEPN